MGLNSLWSKQCANAIRWYSKVCRSNPCLKASQTGSCSINGYRCKVLVVGGGTGGCCVAARLARKIAPESIIVLEPSTIPGLKEALNYPASGVNTVYSGCYCDRAWRCVSGFAGGHAVFTFPRTAAKCPGAAQKIMYLADDYWRKNNKRSITNITYNTGGPAIFGIEKYAKELLQVVRSRCISVNFCMDLVALDDGKAIFEEPSGHKIALPYNFLHVTPPMSPPLCLQKCQSLVDLTGFLAVDHHTLQHTKYPNIYGIGDCTNTPNSKTAAAIAVQSISLQENLLDTMAGRQPTHRYNGYSACPMMTSYHSGILSEFIYDKKICETFPYDQSKEGRLVVYLNKFVFPYLYWNRLIQGKYYGPMSVRKIINPFGKCG